MSESQSKPPVLNELGDNFNEWQKRFKFFLLSQGKLDGLNSDAASQKVLGWIGCSVPAPFLQDICDCTTAKQAWERLKALFTERNQADIASLETAYNELTLEPKETIPDYVTRGQSLHDRLASAGIKQTEEQLCRRLLKGLLKPYNTYRTMVLHGGGTMPKLQAMKASLMSLEADHNRHHRQEEIALLARKPQKHQQKPKLDATRGKLPLDKSKLRCNYCKEPGHFKAECPKKKSADLRRGYRGSDNRPPVVLCSVNKNLCGPYTLGNPNTWVLDSGASCHLTAYGDLLHNYKPFSGSITYGNDTTAVCSGTGDVVLINEQRNMRQLVLTGVKHVPSNSYNVVSMATLMRKGVTFTNSSSGSQPTMTLRLGGELIATAVVYPEVSILVLQATAVSAERQVLSLCAPADDSAAASFGASAPQPLNDHGSDKALLPISSSGSAMKLYNLWHRRFGHLSPDNMAKLPKLVCGMDVPPVAYNLIKDSPPCDICIRSKQTRLPFTLSSSKTTAPLELIHMDLCGPLKPQGRLGHRYFLTMLDDYSGYSVVKLLHTKDGAAGAIQATFNQLSTSTGLTIKVVRTDRGGEFLTTELATFLASKGILHQKTVPYSPEQNGKAERLNRTLPIKTRTLLADSPFDKTFWGEALLTANHMRNLSPVSGKPAVPWELLFNAKPDVSGLRQFGCLAYVLKPKHQRDGKLEPVSTSGFFLGYPEGTKGYQIYMPDSDKTVISRDIKFVESSASGACPLLDLPAAKFNLPTAAEEESFAMQQQSDNSEPDNNPGSSPEPDNDLGNCTDTEEPSDTDNIGSAPADTGAGAASATRTSSRSNRGVPPPRFGDFYGMSFDTDICLAATADKGPTYSEAMASPEKEQWEQAIQEELKSLDANGTYTMVPITPGCKLLPTKWVLKKKYTAAGDFERYKARLVAKGFKQTEGIDFNETFSPTSKYATVRTLFSKAAAEDMELEHVDIKTAFLHGELQEEIYITFPPGMPGPEGYCLKLHKTLYGLKQAPRAWHLRLEEELKRLDFNPSVADPALYTNSDTQDKKVYLLVYVDDIIVASNSPAAVSDAKNKLLTAFDGRDLGPVTSFLGINITRDRANRRLSMDQTSSIKELLSTYGMDNAKPKAVPMDSGLRLSVQDGSPLSVTTCTYPNLVGSLMYLAVSTRPDIAFSMGALARFTTQPTTVSMAAAKSLLRYLAGTADLKLTFSGSTADKGHNLAIYTDSDYAACPDTRKSVSGYVVILNGGAVDWRSKKQNTVTLSTTEAEYVAASAAARETLWFRQLARTLDLDVPRYIICADNQAMIKLAKDPILSARSKHIDVIHHFLRERVARGEVSFIYTKTDKMLADILTKALPKSKHQECCKSLGLM